MDNKSNKTMDITLAMWLHLSWCATVWAGKSDLLSLLHETWINCSQDNAMQQSRCASSLAVRFPASSVRVMFCRSKFNKLLPVRYLPTNHSVYSSLRNVKNTALFWLLTTDFRKSTTQLKVSDEGCDWLVLFPTNTNLHVSYCTLVYFENCQTEFHEI